MLYEIIMPDLGQTTSEARILKWLKRPGEPVARGTPLLEIQTDKVTMEVESHAAGYLREILVSEDQVVPAASLIALVTDTPGESYSPTRGSAGTEPVRTQAAGAAPAAPPPSDDRAVPAARLLAREWNIDLQAIRGSGPEGVITRRDVELYAARRRKAENGP